MIINTCNKIKSSSQPHTTGLNDRGSHYTWRGSTVGAINYCHHCKRMNLASSYYFSQQGFRRMNKVIMQLSKITQSGLSSCIEHFIPWGALFPSLRYVKEMTSLKALWYSGNTSWMLLRDQAFIIIAFVPWVYILRWRGTHQSTPPTNTKRYKIERKTDKQSRNRWNESCLNKAWFHELSSGLHAGEWENGFKVKW